MLFFVICCILFALAVFLGIAGLLKTIIKKNPPKDESTTMGMMMRNTGNGIETYKLELDGNLKTIKATNGGNNFEYSEGGQNFVCIEKGSYTVFYEFSRSGTGIMKSNVYSNRLEATTDIDSISLRSKMSSFAKSFERGDSLSFSFFDIERRQDYGVDVLFHIFKN